MTVVPLPAKLLNCRRERKRQAGGRRPFPPMMKRFTQPRPGAVPHLVVRKRFGGRSLGRLHVGPLALPCVLGAGGLSRAKREGDGATPVGRFALVGGFMRRDRERRPATGLPLRPSRRDDGWCDDAASPRYNMPCPASLRGGARKDVA